MIHLYSDIAKPLVDIGLFAYKLGASVGMEAPLLMISYFFSTGLFLRSISPPFGKCTDGRLLARSDGFRCGH